MDNQNEDSTSGQQEAETKRSYLLPAIVIIGVLLIGMPAIGKFFKPSETNTQVNTTTSTDTQTVQSESTESATTGDIRVFTVEGKNYAFDTNTITVNKGDVVKIILNNTEGRHDLVIDEFNVSTQVLTAGKTDEVQFIADKSGTFEYYCSIGEHRSMGMVGKLIVK